MALRCQAVGRLLERFWGDFGAASGYPVGECVAVQASTHYILRGKSCHWQENMRWSPEVHAVVAALLCSEDAGWITGQVIYADGGASLMNSEVAPEIQLG